MTPTAPTSVRPAPVSGTGMGAGQVPRPDRSVRLGTVRLRAPLPGTAPGRSPHHPVPPQAGGVSGGLRRGSSRQGSHRAPRRRRWSTPLLLAVAGAALVAGAAQPHTAAESRVRPVAAAAPAVSPATSPADRPGTAALVTADPMTITPTAAAPSAQTLPTLAEPTPTGSAPQVAGASAEVRSVVLRRGDTLWQLARHHHTTVKALQDLNGLGTSTVIRAGATLRVSGNAGPAPVTGASSDTTAGANPPTATVPGTAAAAFASRQLGKPYAWGATGPGAFDCSGLVMQAWNSVGVSLPRTTWDMRHAGEATRRADLVPGDLVLTDHGGHVQLYIGDGKVIHAPGRGRAVTVAALPPQSAVTAYRHISN